MRELLLREAAEFRETAARFATGEMDGEEFRTFRLRRGIYGQRQAGVQMVRVKIPSGMATADQLRTLAFVAEEFGGGEGHITTRQDVQIHFVPLARVGDAMEVLGEGGLTTREACGHSVRNVTACPVAGHCPGQAFDVRPFSLATTRRFIRSPLTSNLPRKFKIAFSCSLSDCALGDINDIGLDALFENGRPGFRVRVGGGLGSSPQFAQTLREFVPVEELGYVLDGILKVFDEFTNRKDRHRLRMKFLIRLQGMDWFKEKVEEAIASMPHEPWTVPAPIERQPGEPFLVPIVKGNLNATDFRNVARIAEYFGDSTVTFTINQNLVINGVRAENREALGRVLRADGFPTDSATLEVDVVTCPGAATCNLGLTRSMDLASELQQVMAAERDADARQVKVRIDGCPNSCGHHHIGAIGLYGNARKVEGQTAPFYQLMLGGGSMPEGTRFAKAIASIPARTVPAAVRGILAVYKEQRQGSETFLQFVDRVGPDHFRETVEPFKTAPPEEMLVDWGEEEKFVVNLGRGECAS